MENASPTPIAARRQQPLMKFLISELRPKGSLLTPFNMITAPIVAVGAVLIVIRFIYGIGSITNLTQEYPWGIWIGFDVMAGVAFAGGAYVITFMVYVLGMDAYKPMVRAAVLNGFLAYMFYAGALLLDLGRPWNVINPIIGNSFGFSSVLFLVAWHFMLYMAAQLLEFSPAIAEWLGLERARKVLVACTLGAVIFGITLSTLHQSGLGALFLMAKPKIHPLWYSEFIPILFFVSSVFAGLSMVIVEGSVSHKVFFSQLEPGAHHKHAKLVRGLARVCAGAMFAYLAMVILTFVHGQRWEYMWSGWGAWYLVEVVGLVALPCGLYILGLKRNSSKMLGTAAVMSLIGIALNRLNLSVIAFKWYEANRYVPSWMEIVVTLAVISVELWVFRWVVNRLPVLRKASAWQVEQRTQQLKKAA